MKKEEMDRACGMFVSEEVWIWVLVGGSLKERKGVETWA